jgi:hypothetical protein
MKDLKFDPVECLPLAREFMAAPIGRHTPNLQRLLRIMRAEAPIGKPCLMAIEPGRKWLLFQLAGPRGSGARSLGRVYTDQMEAERDVFRMRWKTLIGTELPKEIGAP